MSLVRGTVHGLGTPHPMGTLLPALYHDDDFAQRLVLAIDDLLAPVLSTVDNLPAYLSPHLAPQDFLDWLSGWVGITLDADWSLERRREVVATAVSLHRRRGTVAGIREAVRLAAGGEVEVVDSGGAVWSGRPGAPLPGSPDPSLVVRVRTADPAAVDRARLDAVITAAKPAHVTHAVEVLPADRPSTTD